MACDLTRGFIKNCKDSVGGTSALFLFNFQADPFTVADGLATAINAAVTEVYEYELTGDGNPFAENKVGDRNTFTSVNTQTITSLLGVMSDTKSNELSILTEGYPMAVVKDRNDNYWAVGVDDGIDFTVDATTGAAKTDLNGYTITGTSTTKKLAPRLDDATVQALLALVVPVP